MMAWCQTYSSITLILCICNRAISTDSRDWFACDKVRSRWFQDGSNIGSCSIPEFEVPATNFTSILDYLKYQDGYQIPIMLRRASANQRNCFTRSDILKGSMAQKRVAFKKNDGRTESTTLRDFVERLMPGCIANMDGNPSGRLRDLSYEKRELTSSCPGVPASVQYQTLKVTTKKIGREEEIHLGGLFVGAPFAREDGLDTWLDNIHGKLKWMFHHPRCATVIPDNAFAVWMKRLQGSRRYICSVEDNCTSNSHFFEDEDKSQSKDDANFSKKELSPPKNCSDYQPLDCLQDAGDVLFIPRGWHFASFNLAETLVAVQRGVPLTRADKVNSIDTAKRIIDVAASVKPEDRGADPLFFSEENLVVSNVPPKSVFDGVLPHEQAPMKTPKRSPRRNAEGIDSHRNNLDGGTGFSLKSREVIVDAFTGKVRFENAAKISEEFREWEAQETKHNKNKEARTSTNPKGPAIRVTADLSKQQGATQTEVFPPPHAPFDGM